MAFIATPDTLGVTLLWRYQSGTVAQNRLYCFGGDPIVTDDLEEAGDAMLDAIVANIVPLTHGSWFLDAINVRALNEAEGLIYAVPGDFPYQGGDEGVLDPANQVSYTVTLNTGLIGRSARGRIYGVGMPPNFHNGVRLTDVAQGVLQPAWDLVREAMETAGHALQVVSFEEGGVPRSEGRPLSVLSTNVRFPLATQRRRLS